MASIDKKVAVVTGGAAGIGAAVATLLAKEGHVVVVADVNAAAANDHAQSLKSMGYQSDAVDIDVGNDVSIQSAFNYIETQYGRCDVLVNNAGIGRIGAFLDCSLDDWNTVLNINLTGMLLCSQAAAKLMIVRKWGRIINVGSVSGFRASGGRTAYGSSKAAVLGLTRQMAIELAPLGITVNGFAPGPVETPMTLVGHSQETRDAYHRAVPLGRYGTVDEMACVASFLASDGASYITGHMIPVDGGYLAAGLLDI